MTRAQGEGNRVVVDGEPSTWRELPGPRGAGSPVAVLTGDSRTALAAVRDHAEHGGELLVAAPGRVDADLRAELLGDGFRLVTDDATIPSSRRRPADDDRVWILTSGSTGRPKRIGHTLASLTTVSGVQPPRVWLCPYSPGTYAWWQLVTLGLTQPGQDLVTVSPDRLDAWPSDALAHGVTAVSGTPTFWRQALLRSGDDVAKVPLEQVTLGGEPVDQAILDRLRETFPAARISWIYASSEVGAAIVVHDGRAGFPRSWLDRESPGRPVLSVRDDELVVASPHHGATLDGAVRTGDRVELTDDRVLVTGRLGSDEINVGGAKISAGAVRDVLHAHPGVTWARVRARRAPIVGHVVVADIVADDAIGDAELTRWAAERLPEYGVPRRLTRLADIPVKETLKSDV
ncbi:MAG: AMP-binding protein [Streptosporangiales bacterium]|nr:AMP-binding protein [Streptosporangiales bacterium]